MVQSSDAFSLSLDTAPVNAAAEAPALNLSATETQRMAQANFSGVVNEIQEFVSPWPYGVTLDPQDTQVLVIDFNATNDRGNSPYRTYYEINQAAKSDVILGEGLWASELGEHGGRGWRAARGVLSDAAHMLGNMARVVVPDESSGPGDFLRSIEVADAYIALHSDGVMSVNVDNQNGEGQVFSQNLPEMVAMMLQHITNDEAGTLGVNNLIIPGNGEAPSLELQQKLQHLVDNYSYNTRTKRFDPHDRNDRDNWADTHIDEIGEMMGLMDMSHRVPGFTIEYGGMLFAPSAGSSVAENTRGRSL